MSVTYLTNEDIKKMFARLSELTLDVSNIRRKFLGRRYGQSNRQVIDVYLPNEGDGPFPAVFFIHGGAWVSGARNDTQIVPFMSGVSRGYAVIGVGYRLVPNVRYPENLYDIKSALRFVCENREEFGIDTNRCALAGASAGAHLALMAAFTVGVPVFEGAPLSDSCRIRAVIDQFGPADFETIESQLDETGYPRAAVPTPGEGEAPDILFGVPLSSIPGMLPFMNPIDSVHADIPPVLIQHGKRDPIVPYLQGIELCKKIHAVAGDTKAELYLRDDLLHADPGFADSDSVDSIFDFLDRHLKHEN
jgi:acetyl esterase/lipase